MSIPTGQSAEVAFCVVLGCAAWVAWLVAGSGGPAAARLRLLTGAAPSAVVRRGRTDRLQQAWRARVSHHFTGGVDRPCADRRSAGPVGTGRHLRAGHVWWCLPVGALLTWWGGSPVPAVLAALAMPIGHRWVRNREARATAERRESEVIDICTVAAGELRTGRLPHEALLATRASRLGPEGSRLLAAARFGGDVPASLQAAAHLPGAHGLRGVAACWMVSADGGTGLADGLDSVADALSAERAQRADVRAELAGPRSTATVLALLPGFGLLLGTAMGVNPFGVLLHTPVGLGCLVAGGVLEWAGVTWVRWLVRRAEADS